MYSSDDKRSPGHLSHQGPSILHWALLEAGADDLDLPDRLALLGLEHVFGPARCPVARQG
jgi:hypothetical protein